MQTKVQVYSGKIEGKKGLFCTKKKPLKAEDIDNENTQYQRVNVKNIKQFFFGRKAAEEFVSSEALMIKYIGGLGHPKGLKVQEIKEYRQGPMWRKPENTLNKTGRRNMFTRHLVQSLWKCPGNGKRR